MIYYTVQNKHLDQENDDYFIGDEGGDTQHDEKASSSCNSPSSDPIQCPSSPDDLSPLSAQRYEQDLCHYNSLTWIMYHRIMNSRKERSRRSEQERASRSSFSSGRWLRTQRLRKKTKKTTTQNDSDTASEISYEDGISEREEITISSYMDEGVFHLEL